MSLMIKQSFTGRKLIQKSRVHQVVSNCYSCNYFPKFKKKLDRPLIRFAQFWFCLMLNKDYFYEGNVLMFELILPRHWNYFGFLSRESNHLRVRRCGEELDIKSEVKFIWSPMYFLYRQLF